MTTSLTKMITHRTIYLFAAGLLAFSNTAYQKENPMFLELPPGSMPLYFLLAIGIAALLVVLFAFLIYMNHDES